MPRRNSSTNKYPETRRHTNNTGYRRIKNGGTRKDIMRIARELGIPYGLPRKEEVDE